MTVEIAFQYYIIYLAMITSNKYIFNLIISYASIYYILWQHCFTSYYCIVLGRRLARLGILTEKISILVALIIRLDSLATHPSTHTKQQCSLISLFKCTDNCVSIVAL